MSFLSNLRSLLNIVLTDRPSIQASLTRNEEENFRQALVQGYGADRLPTVDFRELVKKEVISVANYTYLGGNSLPTDMALVKEMAASIPECRFLEIGSWRGETLSNVASVAKHCYSLTLGADDMRRMGISEKFIESHALFTSQLQNITEFTGDSQVFDFSRIPEKPNLIFVDGDHTYAAVKKDTENSFSVLNEREDSVIIWHDYGYNTEDVRHSVMAAIVDGTPAHLRQYLYHVSNTMCAVFVKQKLPTYTGGFPQFPSKTFDVQLSVKPFSK